MFIWCIPAFKQNDACKGFDLRTLRLAQESCMLNGNEVTVAVRINQANAKLASEPQTEAAVSSLKADVASIKIELRTVATIYKITRLEAESCQGLLDEAKP